MRLVVGLETDLFPVTHSALGISVIKEAIKRENEAYYKELYEGEKMCKNFSYSFYLKNYVKEGDMFVKNEGVFLTISTPDTKFGLTIYNGITKMSEFKYKDFVLKKKFIKIEQEPKVLDTSVLIKTLSPIVVTGEDGKFLTVNDADFTERLNYVTDISLKKFRGYGLNEPIVLEPLNVKKVVVKQSLREFKEITHKPYHYVDANLGTFALMGNREDIAVLCQLGLGFRRGQGFGNLKVI